MNNKYAGIGLACLALTACDNGSNRMQPANTAPVLGAIVDQSTSANVLSAAIGFTVNDESPGTVVITATSDNQDVIADDAIELGGSAGNRSILVTPIADTLGDAMITISAADTGGLSDSTSFLLTITPEQKSLQQYTRTTFADSADGDPGLINAVEFAADAEADDFADLLAQ